MKSKWALFAVLAAVVAGIGWYQNIRPSKSFLVAGSVGLNLVKRLGRQLCLQTIGKSLCAALLAIGAQKVCEKALFSQNIE